jgi:hypothetical protein
MAPSLPFSSSKTPVSSRPEERFKAIPDYTYNWED